MNEWNEWTKNSRNSRGISLNFRNEKFNLNSEFRNEPPPRTDFQNASATRKNLLDFDDGPNHVRYARVAVMVTAASATIWALCLLILLQGGGLKWEQGGWAPPLTLTTGSTGREQTKSSKLSSRLAVDGLVSLLILLQVADESALCKCCCYSHTTFSG